MIDRREDRNEEVSEKEDVEKRLEENTKYFRQIDSAFKSGTIEDSLGNDYDRTYEKEF